MQGSSSRAEASGGMPEHGVLLEPGHSHGGSRSNVTDEQWWKETNVVYYNPARGREV
jgi:hypothetical protein